MSKCKNPRDLHCPKTDLHCNPEFYSEDDQRNRRGKSGVT